MVLQALGSSLPSTSSYSSCNYFKNNKESLVNVFWGVDYNKINYPRAWKCITNIEFSWKDPFLLNSLKRLPFKTYL